MSGGDFFKKEEFVCQYSRRLIDSVLDCAVWQQLGNSRSPEKLQKETKEDNGTGFGTCEGRVSCGYKVCTSVEKIFVNVHL
jgi:hypothetical protein